MTVTEEQLRILVLESLHEVLSIDGNKNSIEITGDTRLIGHKDLAILDSLGLASLVIDIEERLESRYGIAITVADDRAMSQRNSPFRTVDSLVEYLCQVLNGLS